MMLYLTYGNVMPITPGVRKKIEGQIEAFSNLFGDVYLVYVAFGAVRLILRDKIIERKLATDLHSLLIFIEEWVGKYDIDKIYIRYKAPLEHEMIVFLEDMKKKGVKTVYEFPTYPTEKEIINKSIMAEDFLNRPYIKDELELTTTFFPTNDIYGVPTAVLQNGVSMRQNKVRKLRKRDGEIHLLAVATMIRTHGYERILRGINEDWRKYSNYKIKMCFAGEGKEVGYYKELVREFDLINDVFFVGKKIGDELDELYDWADIGIGSLGMYKAGYNSASPIKLREYCVRGLPFVYGYDDMGFSGEERFLRKVSNDDKNVSMTTVIDLYEETAEKKEIVDEMRLLAENRYTWERTLQPVLDFYRVGSKK